MKLKVRIYTIINSLVTPTLMFGLPFIILICSPDAIELNFLFIIIIYIMVITFIIYKIFVDPLIKFYKRDRNRELTVNNDTFSIYNNSTLDGTFEKLDVKKVTYFLPHSAKMWNFYCIQFELKNGKIFTISSILFKNDKELTCLLKYFDSSIINNEYVQMQKLTSL